jgi:hypothetical protein
MPGTAGDDYVQLVEAYPQGWDGIQMLLTDYGDGQAIIKMYNAGTLLETSDYSYNGRKLSITQAKQLLNDHLEYTHELDSGNDDY